MARLTPPVGTKGLFLVRTPYTTRTDVEYHVTAQRTFEEIRARGTPVLDLVYKPVGLTQADYDADVAAGAMVITLAPAVGDPIYIPDTYIESYPFMGSVPYNRLVATCSLGMLPAEYDTALLEQTVKAAVSDYIGVEPVVKIMRAPTSDYVTEEQHVQLTIARQQAVNNRNTDRAQVLSLTQQLTAAQQTIAEYEAIIAQLQSG